MNVPIFMMQAQSGIGEIFGLLDGDKLSGEVQIFLLISALSFLPFLLIAITTFTRNIIVLSFLRHALGLQHSPPNIILITLAMFLAIFTMSPIIDQSYQRGVHPYLEGMIDVEEGVSNAWEPFRNFLISQTKESDIQLIYKLSRESVPDTSIQVSVDKLIPAFLLSELRTAFTIGFIIFLPFLLLDIVIAAVLMSLGMFMVPPITISLPMKIMLFVVVDGWSLIAETLIRSVSG